MPRYGNTIKLQISIFLRLDKNRMIKKKYIKKNIVVVTIISTLVIALFFMFRHNEYDEDNKNSDRNNELIVLFHDIPNEEEVHMLLEGYEGYANIAMHLEDYVLISIDDDEIYPDIINYLSANPLVRIVEPNSKIQLMQNTNDPYSSSQWAIHNPGYYSVFSSVGNSTSGNSTSGKKEVSAAQDVDMDVAEAWIHMKQENVKRREVVVAIIDTGIDYTHPDLADNMWVNKNEIPNDGIDNDNNGYVDDIYGWDFYNDDSSVCHYKYDSKTKTNLYLPEDNDNHGSHIAGIIGAVADNGIGIAGIASNIDIKLMALKINGGKDGTGSISDAILAIKYATMMGADICNISWGTSQYSAALKETIKESDMLFVAAAGNLGQNNDNKPVYPAGFNLDNLISVTFIDADGRLTRLSNYGKKSVEIAAPGTDILSTVVGSYQTLSGSSMAAPHVSAVASLLYSYDKNLYPLAVKNLILSTVKPISGLKDSMLYPGIPSAYHALLEAEAAKRDFVPPVISVETVHDRENLLVKVRAEDKDGSGVRVVRWLAGVRTLKDFNRGTAGLTIEDNQINVSKAGTYTVYASDYAGNESIYVHEVQDDITPPLISSFYTVSEDYRTRTVNIRVTDDQTGIRRVKYMRGNKNVSDFLPAGSGTELKLKDDKASFEIKEDGEYTLYAIDNRGNHTVSFIEVKTILSEDIKFTRTDIKMSAGERDYLRAFVKPANTTDVITYTSSNERVAMIGSNGKVVALREGTATITARTNSGIKAVCRIVVEKRN